MAKQDNWHELSCAKEENYFNTLFLTSNSSAILKSVIKSLFSISLTVSEKISTSKFFMQSEFLGTGGDENLIINFL